MEGQSSTLQPSNAGVQNVIMPRPPYGGHYEMMAGVCRVARPNSRTARSRKPKIGRMEAHHTSNPWTYLEVKMSRSSGWRAVIDNARYGDRLVFPWHKAESESGHYNFLNISLFYKAYFHTRKYLAPQFCLPVRNKMKMTISIIAASA